MAQVEASGVVAAGRRELFYYTDWCYNVPEWFEPVRKARILHLPDSRGMGKVTSYAGTLFGRNMEWEAQSAEWVEDRAWAMRASRGAPAKMSMQIRFRFEAVGADSTNVTCRVSYHAPFPLVGRLVDRFYLRKEAMRLANLAVQGLRKAADHNRVPPLVAGFEKRKADHPGYGAESVEKAPLALTES